uniref:P-type Zn(2+) transporter n=1 Tax=Candidatus Nitrotoga fabula TaxID=2182327 RepID=A0A2X0QWM4_9PROT|nr:putative heavy metal-transporting ATPase [Candidatus Nitrotoga fabula]
MGCSSCDPAAPAAPMPPPWRNLKVVTSAIAGTLLAMGFFGAMAGLPTPVATGLYIAAVLIGGYFFGREALAELVSEHAIGIELLMLVATLVAGVMGQWAEAATLAFLYSISEAAEGYTAERARHAIRSLMDLAPKTALVRREGKEVRIPVEELRVGDVFIVLPGEAIATDGEVIEGRSSVNQAPVTGESVPVEKSSGAKVFAATLNGEGALTVRATQTFANNTIARIIQLVEQAQQAKGRSQRFIEQFGRRYSPAVLVVGVLLALVPPLFGFSWEEWLTRATVFIVAAAPCALVISIPITLVAAIGTAGRNGVLVKGGVHLENLAKVRVIALDKTGTLTMGRPQVTQLIPLNAHKAEHLLAVAAALESRSQHPLARAVSEHATALGVDALPVEDFQSLTGMGAKGRVQGGEWFIGSPKLFREHGTPLETVDAEIARLQGEGNTVVIVGTATHAVGLLAIADPLRPGAAAAVAGLKQAGIERIVMLTGDNTAAAKAIALQAGIDEVHAELSPEDKTRVVAELQQRYGHVAMVGDGVNDAPALAAAEVGIAMGAAGTDVALETADMALMGDDLSRLAYAVTLSRRNRRVIQQNLGLSAVVIGGLVIGAIAGVFTLPMAVLAHEISEFVVIASGLRMLRT